MKGVNFDVVFLIHVILSRYYYISHLFFLLLYLIYSLKLVQGDSPLCKLMKMFLSRTLPYAEIADKHCISYLN